MNCPLPLVGICTPCIACDIISLNVHRKHWHLLVTCAREIMYMYQPGVHSCVSLKWQIWKTKTTVMSAITVCYNFKLFPFCRYAIILGSTTDYESLQNQILLGFKYKVQCTKLSLDHGTIKLKWPRKSQGHSFFNCMGAFSLWIHPCKVIQDSLKLCIPCCVFRIWFPCKWNLDSGIQIPDSFEEFWIPWAEFQIPKPRILDYLTWGKWTQQCFLAGPARSAHVAHFFIGTSLCCLCSTSMWNFLLWSCMEDLNTWQQLILSLLKLGCGPKNSSPGIFTYMCVWHIFRKVWISEWSLKNANSL